MSRTRHYVPDTHHELRVKLRSNQVPSRRRQDAARTLAEELAWIEEDTAEALAAMEDDWWPEVEDPDPEGWPDGPLYGPEPVPGTGPRPEPVEDGRRT